MMLTDTVVKCSQHLTRKTYTNACSFNSRKHQAAVSNPVIIRRFTKTISSMDKALVITL